MLEIKIKNCQKCNKLFSEKPKEPFIKFGKDKIVLVVGEFPKREAQDFFYNQKGKLFKSAERLNDYLKIIGLSLESITFTEMCKCMVCDRKQLKEAAENCYEFLNQQIKDIHPNLVITIGILAKEIFSKKNNQKFEIGEIYKIDWFSYLPIFHPSPANPKGHQKNLEIFRKNKKKLIPLLKFRHKGL